MFQMLGSAKASPFHFPCSNSIEKLDKRTGKYTGNKPDLRRGDLQVLPQKSKRAIEGGQKLHNSARSSTRKETAAADKVTPLTKVKPALGGHVKHKLGNMYHCG